jgi:hypothetical protein
MSDYIDDAFRVEETRWKTWRSYTKEGKGLITALTEDQCIAGTRFYLKGLQEGWPETHKYDGTVGGKL